MHIEADVENYIEDGFKLFVYNEDAVIFDPSKVEVLAFTCIPVYDLKAFAFFFSSRRRHTRSVSAFLLNRSSDLLGKIGVFHNRRNASSRLLLLISKHLILCIYLVFRILA